MTARQIYDYERIRGISAAVEELGRRAAADLFGIPYGSVDHCRRSEIAMLRQSPLMPRQGRPPRRGKPVVKYTYQKAREVADVYREHGWREAARRCDVPPGSVGYLCRLAEGRA